MIDSEIPIQIKARENPYEKYIAPNGHQCATCDHRIKSFKCAACQKCIWFDDLPNWVGTHKLDEFPGFKAFFEGKK
jgi:hypothetical protein